VNGIEAGRVASLESYARLSVALDRPLEISADAHRAATSRQRSDLVHSAMAELEADRLTRHACRLAIDEPYQHYQFAGRADLIAWVTAPPRLLHIENRTRFPDVQEIAGSFNAKCRYMPGVIARRVGVKAWASETHVLMGLWSSEVMHVVRARRATFQALCPDPMGGLLAWLDGRDPPPGETRCFAVLDPMASGRQRVVTDLDAVLRGVAPRVRDYREAADRLRASGRG
jgi:hypothetical protein